jgi:hypothetical protein
MIDTRFHKLRRRSYREGNSELIDAMFREINCRSNPVSRFQQISQGRYRCPVVVVGYRRCLSVPRFQNS